jgi:hypothetical protein
MLGILLPEILEDGSSAFVVKTVDAIEPLCRALKELRRLQTLGEKWIRQAAEY